jgi:hypothetical protein
MHQLHLAARHQAVVVNENLRTQRENSMDITSLIIQLVSGAVGGNIGGVVLMLIIGFIKKAMAR